MGKLTFFILLLIGSILLVADVAEGEGGYCSFRWSAVGDGYCWKYCSGNSGKWCYTSNKKICSKDSDCGSGAYTLCSNVNWCKGASDEANCQNHC